MKNNYIKTFESIVLNEEETNEHLIKDVLSKYLELYKQKPFESLLFRGTDYYIQDEFKIVQPKEKRKSISFSQSKYDAIHNLWMSGNENWKDYPSRRDFCTITSTSHSYASEFGGSLYVVFPINIQSTILGVCPKPDLINSFSTTITKTSGLDVGTNIEDFSFAFYRLLNEFPGEIDLFNQPDTYEQLIKNLEIVNNKFLKKDNVINPKINHFQKELINLVFKWCKDNNKSLFQFFEYLLDPTINGFELKKDITELSSNIGSDNGKEVWFNDSAIFMDIDYYKPKKKNEEYEIEEIMNQVEKYINS
jgi:hypothetical protein